MSRFLRAPSDGRCININSVSVPARVPVAPTASRWFMQPGLQDGDATDASSCWRRRAAHSDGLPFSRMFESPIWEPFRSTLRLSACPCFVVYVQQDSLLAACAEAADWELQSQLIAYSWTFVSREFALPGRAGDGKLQTGGIKDTRKSICPFKSWRRDSRGAEMPRTSEPKLLQKV